MAELLTNDRTLLTKHVAIIMDGNGRWAKRKHMPRSYGHKKGVEKVREIVKASSRLGIQALTLFAFSTENWKRPKEEVGFLMSLLMEYLKNEVRELHENGVVLRCIGNRSQLSPELVRVIEESEQATAGNSGLRLTVAVNYGGRDEVLAAAASLAEDYKLGKISAPSEEEFEKRLCSSFLPDVDLMIRTSGEMRISNFLLYTGSYAELYFTDVYWPDFSEEEYVKALNAYLGRNRRYGGTEC